MAQPFYAARLASHGLEVIVPTEPDQQTVHRSIYDELCVGPDDSSVPVFAITRLHVQAAVDRALNAG